MRAGTVACRATRGTTATRSSARSSTSSDAGSAGATACSSTRTSTSTARRRLGAASVSTGRTRLLITRRHGSWVVLGTLVTDVELEPTPAARDRLRRVPALHRRLPDRRARRGRACSTRPSASPTGRSRPRRSRRRTARRMGAQVYGCDICQDVCPWNRGVEKRRRDEPRRGGARLARRLAQRRRSRAACPVRPSLRAAERRPTPAAERARRGRQRRRRARACSRRAVRARRRPTARRARAVGARADGSARMTPRRSVERWIGWVRLGGVLFALIEVGFFSSDFPRQYHSAAWAITAVFGVGAVALFFLIERASESMLRLVGAFSLVFDTAVIWSYGIVFTFEFGNQTRWATIFVARRSSAALRPPRRRALADRRRRLLRVQRVVARPLLRAARLRHRPGDVPDGRDLPHGPDRRLARLAAGRGGAHRRGTRRGGRAPP